MGGASGCTVLFVDDEPRVLQGLERMMRGRRAQWRLRFATSAREAVALLEREAFDAVVTDLRMPEMDGADLLHTVQKRWPQTARIVLSGELDQKAALAAVRCAHQYLFKPCDPETLQLVLEQAFGLGRLIEDHGLKSLLARLNALPSLPAIYVEVLSEMRSPNASSKKVGQLIARDVSMTAKILQIVNSAFFGMARRIGTAQEAVALLGWDTVKALVLSAKVFAQFDTRRIGGFSMEELWRHSLETGRCARVVGIAEKMPRLALEEAFTAGILHDLGKPILAQNFPEIYSGVLARAQAQGRAVRDLELECFGACHAKLAAYLMGLWGVGEGVVDAIAFHHRPSESPSEALAIGAVHAANAIAHRLSGAAGEGQAEDVGFDLDYLARGDRLERLPVWQEACLSGRPEEGGTC